MRFMDILQILLICVWESDCGKSGESEAGSLQFWDADRLCVWCDSVHGMKES